MTPLALTLFGIRLRVGAVAYFLDRARLSPDRATLAALAFHARLLRERCEKGQRLA